MKKIVSFAFICLALCLSSCDFLDFSSSSDNKPQSQFQEQKISNLQKEIESLRTEIAAINAVSAKDAASHIDSLNNSISYIKERLDVLENADKKVDERISNIEKSKSERYFWILLGVCLIVSGVVFILALKVHNIDRRLNRHREDIEELIHDNNHANYLNQNVQTLFNSIRCMDQELNNLKLKYNSVLSQMAPRFDGRRGGGGNLNERRNSNDNNTSEKKPEDPKISGYFGDIIGGTYFRDLMAYRNDQAVFSVLANEDVAEFEPLSLNLLRGNDNVHAGIETTGARLQDATSMAVETPGMAEKVMGKWIIKSKAKIKLS